MVEKTRYRSVSIPTGITDEIEKLIEELMYWPSVGAFVREAALEKIRKERRRLRERREAEGSPIEKGSGSGHGEQG